MAEQPSRRILIVDDEAMIRELLELLLARSGYITEQAESPEDALKLLERTGKPPTSILIDMQMPGISGGALANRIHSVCGSNMRLIAMSASEPEQTQLEQFDAFLRKPFSEDDLNKVLKGDRVVSEPALKPHTTPVLNPTIYEKLAGSMSRENLDQLYQLCLSDCRRRMDLLHQAFKKSDEVEYRSQGHAIRGSCGMVGAAEMESLAWSIEKDGFAANSMDTLNDLISACERLEGIVGERRISINDDDYTRGGEEKTV
jgi:CheY-like chemotaxis protein